LRTAERLLGIMRFLCRERHTTVSVLAEKFGVSERTVRRDIFELSFVMPIDTKSGKYGGGIYVIGDYAMDRMYMTPEELKLLARLRKIAENRLADSEIKLLDCIIRSYAKPANNSFKPDGRCQC